MYPLKVNILSFDKNNSANPLKIKNTYVFVGNVDNTIKKAIESPNTEKSKSILKNKFGAKWKTLLDLDVKGGDEINLDEEISIAEISAITSINSEINTPHKIELQKDETKSKEKYIYNNIYPHDNIMDFKRKLSLALDIPIYKQHIWYEYSGKIFNVNYNIYLQSKIVNISFADAISHSENNRYGLEYIENTPVLVNFYNVKKLLSIKAYDAFSTVDDITSSLGVNEFNLINLDEIFKSIKEDDTAMEMIYYGMIILFWPMFTYEAWINYIKNKSTFEKIYPDIALDSKQLHYIYTKQSNITDAALSLFDKNASANIKKEIKDIEKSVYISITHSIIQVISMYNSSVINLRNLFDNIQLNKVIVSCKCSLIYEGKKLLLLKSFKNEPDIQLSIPLRSILIKIRTQFTDLELYIYTDGNYTVKSKWPEADLLNFGNVLEIVSKEVNQIIDKINNYPEVVNSNANIIKMTVSNAKFTEVYLSLVYRKYVKYGLFKSLEEVLKELEDANIIIFNDENPAENSVSYFFSKGMYKMDISKIEKFFDIINHYSYLTDGAVKAKWKQLYIDIRKTVFQYRSGDVKISIEGIRESEFQIFYTYLIYVLHQMLYVRKETKVTKEPIKKLNIKSLKQQDPALYKKNIPYSKICQKQYQPTIVNNEQYKKMSDSEKKRVVRWHNFTTNSSADYYCPNNKFPFLKFIVGKHPDGACLPCCKKKEIEDSDNKIKREIYQTCLTQHLYKKEKTNFIQDTRYIMNYGKVITPGRLCNLPENSLEPLLYENFSETAMGIESECQDQSRFYIYGVEQNITEDKVNLKFVGYIVALSITLEIPVKKLVDNLIAAIKKDESKFRLLMDGHIIKYFYSAKDLCNELFQAFNQLYDRDIPWNDVFIELAYYYLGIITVIFVDTMNESDNVKILINNHIMEIEQMANSDKKLMIVIKKKQEYHPVYYINHIVYFRTKIIGKKLFVENGDANLQAGDPSNSPVNIISKFIMYTKTNKQTVGADINLSVLLEFIKTIKYKVTTFFINSDNFCYYVEITDGKGNTISFPITQSTYIIHKDIKLSHEPNFKYNTSLKSLNFFIKAFNHWIAVESMNKGFVKDDVKKSAPVEQRVNPIYSYIVVDKWILLKNPFSGKGEKIIGFMHKNINYYHEEISVKEALKLSNSEDNFLQLLYHPKEINKTLSIVQKPVEDHRTKNILISMYNFYIYELLLLEFTEFFNKQRNTSLRQKIKKIIINNIDDSTVDTISKISEAIPSESSAEDSYKTEDIKVITNQINTYVSSHRDKKILFNQIDIYFYNFDKQMLNSLKRLDKEKLINELYNISKKIVQISEKIPKTGVFPNILHSCENEDAQYCFKKKLIMTDKKLLELLDIMASDILNPFKEKWIFSMLYTGNIISYLKFKKFPDETIKVQII